MRYRVTFEFDAESNPSEWYWISLLRDVGTPDDTIDWPTFTLEEAAGWTEIPVDTL